MEVSFTQETTKNRLRIWGAVTICSLLGFQTLIAQTTTIVSAPDPHQRTVIPGAEYRKGSLHRWLWGSDYRKEWTTPATFPVLNLDSAFGGLTVVKEGGGRQTKTLRLKDAKGKHYLLRTVNKTYLGVLPEIVQGTFVENLANDQVASDHPYAALTVPQMSDAAGIYHTHPKYFIVPYSERLGIYNREFANTLCLLEERPDGSQTTQPDFGQPENIINSDELMETLLKENNQMVDQQAYVKARLFDMFIGDWGRNKKNWRWARFDSGAYKIYRPIPIDRDQTYSLFEGVLLKAIISYGKFRELQKFDADIKNIKWYNYPAFPLDKRLTNALPQQVWIDSAKALQQSLTDAVIEDAVRQMPPQAFRISGEDIIRKLKSRRDHLVDYAKEYYAFLSKYVEVPGTQQNEVFEVKRLNDEETSVTVYSLNKKDEKSVIYARTFLNKETKEIRVYGIGGHDVFNVSGTVNRGSKVRVIGGPGKDSLTDRSYVGGWGHKTKFYDNPGNSISASEETKVHLSRFPSINHYDYDIFNYDSRGIKPVIYYNTYYKYYVGISYGFTRQKTREGTFLAKHNIGINYSIGEQSFHPYYKGSFTQLIGRWNFNLSAGYDGVRRVNYFGLGNESTAFGDNSHYYWLRTKDIYGSFGIDQTFNNHHNVRLDFLYDAVKVVDSHESFSAKELGYIDPDTYNWKQFGGGQLTYSYININDFILPTKGINFQLGTSYTQNLKESGHGVSKAFTSVNLYWPLLQPFSLAVKSGAATLWGKPEFYQYNTIGGFHSLRGFWNYRFYGSSAVYNQNELRWLPTVKGHFYSGRIGLLAFFDQGRVWLPGENSSQWHYGYGGGLMIFPFNKIAVVVTYATSVEGGKAEIRLGKFF
jgi:hypothetical protein